MFVDVSREIVIDRPRQVVWDYISDFARHTEWAAPAHNLRLVPPSELRAGATFTSIGHELGRDWHNTVTITDVVPGRRLEFCAEHDTSTWRNFFELSDRGAATLVVKGERYVSAGFPMILLVALLSPWLQWETGRMFTADLAKIKAMLERDAGPR